MAEQTSPTTLAVGDHVRLLSRAANDYEAFSAMGAQIATSREPIDGLILSIRNIATGELVAQASGDLSGYAIEMVYDDTFSPRHASSRNAPRGIERATASPAWMRLHNVLRDLGSKGQLYSTNTPNFLSDSPLAKLVDGWKVLKVRSADIVSLEPPREAEAAEAAAE